MTNPEISNNSETQPQQENVTHLPPPITVKDILDFESMRSDH